MNSENPKVTVICLCYNQEQFVVEALESVAKQTYSNIQLIVVDDASTDQSYSCIEAFCLTHPTTTFIRNKTNMGNCASFNVALEQAKGKYLVDLAADDVMLRDRIEKQVTFFEALPEKVGVIHHIARLIDSDGNDLGEWKATRKYGGVQGNVFSSVLQFTCIATPTMMFRRSLINEMCGYNSKLSFEDFDFWIRSAQICEYGFQNELLTLWRKVKGSMSTQNKKQMLLDVYKVLLVCKSKLNGDHEYKAWNNGVAFYQRYALFLGHYSLSQLFWQILETKTIASRLIFTAAYIHLPLTFLYNTYSKIRG